MTVREGIDRDIWILDGQKKLYPKRRTDGGYIVFNGPKSTDTEVVLSQEAFIQKVFGERMAARFAQSELDVGNRRSLFGGRSKEWGGSATARKLIDLALMEPQDVSSEDYRLALASLALTEAQAQWLTAHASMPDGRASMRQLSTQVGHADWETANLLYGGMAKLIGKRLPRRPAHLRGVATPQGMAWVARHIGPGPDGEAVWEMMPQLRALYTANVDKAPSPSVDTSSKTREFRSPESYQFEKKARDAVVPFLQSRGIAVSADRRTVTGSAESQLILATLPDGTEAAIRVRLCWRKDDRKPKEGLYSAAQLRARKLDSGWEDTLADITKRSKDKGDTHFLLFQRNRATETHAALIPVEHIAPIWHKQREISDQLIRDGKLASRKNHAANGSSPTLWLQDDRWEAAHAVPDVLWSWPGVVDLMKLVPSSVDDTFDDNPVQHGDEVGNDGGKRMQVTRSLIPRDSKVRALVRDRANGKCERCGMERTFSGFLDVHHIMGVEKSDRTWTCVALCPNCHREAHFSHEVEEIRSELTRYAERFRK